MTDEKDYELIESEGSKFFTAISLLKTPLNTLTDDAVHMAWSILDVIEKAVKTRKEEMRKRLLEVAEKQGEEDEKGSFKAFLLDGWIQKRKSYGKTTVKEGALRKLLREKDISANRVFVTRIVEELDVKALKNLVDQEIITKDELKNLYDEGKAKYSLYVGKPSSVQKLLKK